MDPFKKPMAIIQLLEQHGHEAYFVGGAVRDFLLGRTIGDIDIATSALPEEIMSIFPKTIDVGAKHGTVIVLLDGDQYEVTTFRSEEGYSDFRRPSSVRFIKSLEEDLKRRDFTMNAIAMTKDGKIIDPFGGQEAVQQQMIETVGIPEERFNEDALRMMRAIRFASQLNFHVHEETKRAINEYKHLLKHISIERITAEFEKMFMGENCAKAFRLLVETNLYQYLPGLSNEKEAIQKCSALNWSELKDRSDYWTLFVYHLSDKHEVGRFLRAWKLPNIVIRNVKHRLEFLHKVFEKGWSKQLLFECGKNHALSVERMKSLILQEDVHTNIKVLKAKFNDLPLQSPDELVVDGHDLLQWVNKKPGPWIKTTLEQIQQAVLENVIPNDKAAIKEWLKTCNLKLE
jgi:tRNA nucleotidyltransferase (CCA-adding enzyme)